MPAAFRIHAFGLLALLLTAIAIEHEQANGDCPATIAEDGKYQEIVNQEVNE